MRFERFPYGARPEPEGCGMVYAREAEQRLSDRLVGYLVVCKQSRDSLYRGCAVLSYQCGDLQCKFILLAVLELDPVSGGKRLFDHRSQWICLVVLQSCNY